MRSKRNLSTTNWIITVSALVLSLAAIPSVLAQEPPRRIIFLHHSTGENLINEGGVREELTGLGYAFFDHGYNDDGLRLADGAYAGSDFDVPGDNTDPDGFAEIFAQPLRDPPDNTFSHLMQYDVIAFKSCFPVSNIWDDDRLEEYKRYYRAIRDRVDQYPEKLFIIVTQPPQVPAETDTLEAARARAFVDWLQSDEYLSGHPNLVVFDFFDLLASSDNVLRPEYRIDEYDAHPNERANSEIGPLFAAFIAQAVEGFQSGESRPGADSPTPPPAITLPSEEQPTGALTVDDFESPLDDWWYTDAEVGSSVECAQDTGTAHSGSGSLRILHDVQPHGWADCGHEWDVLQDWSGSPMLSLSLLADRSATEITLMLFSGDPNAPTPFEVYFETAERSMEQWQSFVFSWEAFERAEWADETGLETLDPSRITGYGFSIGANEDASQGTLWIDDVALVTTSVVEPPAEPQPGVSDAEEVEDGSTPSLCGLPALGLPLGAVALARRRRQVKSCLQTTSRMGR